MLSNLLIVKWGEKKNMIIMHILFCVHACYARPSQTHKAGSPNRPFNCL